MDYKEVRTLASLITMVLFDVLIIIFGIHLFFNINTTILAGIIGFLGAIIGGAITYIGVKLTLKHRDREVFMETVGKKIFALEDSNEIFGRLIQALFLGEQIQNNKEKILRVLESFKNELNQEYKKLRGLLDYDFLTILNFKSKSLERLIEKVHYQEKIDVNDLNECMEKARDIYSLCLDQKDTLRKKYYKYK